MYLRNGQLNRGTIYFAGDGTQQAASPSVIVLLMQLCDYELKKSLLTFLFKLKIETFYKIKKY